MRGLSHRIIALGLVIVWIGGPSCADQPSPDSLDQIRELIDQARFDEADALARHVLAKTESEEGPTSMEAAKVLDLLVETLWRARRTDAPETRELAERALQIKEERLGPNHLETAESLLNLAVVLEFSGQVAEAEPLYERAVGVRERALGPQAPEVGDALTYLANMYLNTGRFEEAEPLYERVLEIRTNTHGPHHPKVARTLSNQAILLYQTGDYQRSKELYRQTLAIEEAVFGREHIDVAWTLNGLAGVLWETGEYSEALSLYERALAIRTKALGREHLHVAMTLNNIGLLSQDMGDYAKARSDFERALTIVEKAVGTDSPYAATIRNNLAALYRVMGQYTDARRLQEEVLAVRMRVHGPDHASVGGTLYRIAEIQAALGQYAQAAGSYERVLVIYEKSLGPSHMEYGRALTGLARVRVAMGKLEKARIDFNRSLAIQEEALGADHPFVAQTLEDLGHLELKAGQLVTAQTSLERALTIRETELGPEHPLVGRTLSQLGEIHARKGDTASALQLALGAEEIGRNHLRLTLRTLAERQALRYAAVRSSGLDLILFLAARELDPKTVRRAWDALSRSRALVLDEMALRRGLFARDEDPEVVALQERLASASRRLANLTLRGTGTLPAERHRNLMDEAREQKETAEVALALESAAFRQEQKREQVGLDRVVESLPPETALVAFALHGDSYLAFVLESEGTAPVAMPLGDAEEIHELVRAWREEAARGLARVGRSPEEAEAAYREVGRALRRVIWDPLASRLGDAKQVFIVPDAELHLVSFPALPDDRSGYLIETEPVMHLLSAERDVVSSSTQTVHGSGLLALGGPAFDDGTLVRRRALGVELIESSMRIPGGRRSSCGDFRTLRFPPLPASAREARAVAALWSKVDKAGRTEEASTIALLGADASEANFKKQASGKRVLHLATHGFFLGEQCPSLLETRGVGGLVGASGDDPAPSRTGENPLLLSGLALAGANHRAEAKADEEDGILTAEEIAAMDLRGVQWAVLSACDTGIGKVQAREGVLGLRRAFQVAGTGTVVMSLWSVGDEATERWMRELYEGRLGGGLDTVQAVREAGLTFLRQQRQNEEVTHPFYWAAFVAVGDWR